MRERLTITINKSLLKKIDNLIDGVYLRNRSHAIESLIKKSLNINSPKTAFILAGGKGTRLRPITYEIPKPMIPINGKPILEHQINLLQKHNVRNIIIAVGHLKDRVINYFGDGAKFGVHIEYVIENEPLGTAGALRLAKDKLKDTFIMLNGDNLINIDIDDFFEFHKKNNGLATIALTTVDDPSSFGVALLNGAKITQFIEKPEKPISNLINSGAYILEPEIINLIPEGKASMEYDVFPQILRIGKLIGYSFEGQWLPTDNYERYEKAIKEWGGID